MDEIASRGGTPRFAGGKDTAAAGGGIADTFKTIQGMLNEEAVKNMGGVFLFDLKGKSLKVKKALLWGTINSKAKLSIIKNNFFGKLN